MKWYETSIRNLSEKYKTNYGGNHSFNKLALPALLTHNIEQKMKALNLRKRRLEENSEDECKQMVGRCCVCSDDKCTSNNLLVYCDGCNVAVHKGCYGIINVSATTDWFCRGCEFKQENASKHEQIVIYF